MKLHITQMVSFLAALLFSCSVPAHAANQGPGNVTYISVQNGVAIFAMSGTVSGSWPGCATLTRFAFVTTTAAGQAYYAALITAKMANKSVVVWGAGDCSAWFDSETISLFYINP